MTYDEDIESTSSIILFDSRGSSSGTLCVLIGDGVLVGDVSVGDALVEEGLATARRPTRTTGIKGIDSGVDIPASALTLGSLTFEGYACGNEGGDSVRGRRPGAVNRTGTGEAGATLILGKR